MIKFIFLGYYVLSAQNSFSLTTLDIVDFQNESSLCIMRTKYVSL